MCGGGGGNPAPPPDYSAEKAQFAADKMAEYQAQADAYNAQVNQFNTNLDSYDSSLGKFENQVSGATLYDLYDDPNTAANENYVGIARDTLNDFDMSNLTGNYEKPNFQTSFNTEWGVVNLGELPELSTVNTTLADDLATRADALSGTIDDLYSQRDTAVANLNQGISGLTTDYEKLNLGINRANPFSSDLGALDNAYIDLKSGVGALDQRLLAQTNPQYNVDSILSNTQSSINNLYNTRDAEYNRVANFESGLRNTITDQLNTLAGLDITNVDEMNAVNQALRGVGTQMGGFSSQVGFDLSDEMNYLNAARDELAALQGRRQNELDRIDDFRGDLVDDLRGLRNLGQATSIYDMSAIDALGNELADIQADRQGFSSVLDYDFGNTESYDTAIQNRIDSLLNSRRSVIDQIASGVSGASSDLNNIPLYNETEMRNRLNDLEALGNNLGMFTGGRVDEIGQNMMVAQRDIQARLNQLQAYRANLEKEMSDYIQTLRERDYYNFDDVASARDDVAAKNEQVNLYKAQQAFDEIDRMEAYLNEQFNRLKADQEAVMARNASAGSAGASSLFGAPSYTPMTVSQFNALANYGDDEEQYSTYNPTAFSNSLGVIRL